MPTMRQAPHPQSSPTPTPSDAHGHQTATPYGVMPHGPHTPALSPYAALTPGYGPQSGQQVDYPYLFQAQTAPPTQPVAPHLSGIGQPARSIVANGIDSDPYSAGPTASFPRFAPTPTPEPLPMTPQPFAPPAPVSAPLLGVTRKATSPSPAPWGRDRLAALVLTLLAIGLHVVWTINDTSANDSFPSLHNPTTQDYYNALYYIPHTLGAWWLILVAIPIITITRNQASAITTAASLQLFFIDILIFNNSLTGNPLPILCLLATGGAAIFTTLMGRTTQPPRHWLVSLGMGMNLFLLVSMLHRLMRIILSAKQFRSGQINQTINIWMTPAIASNDRGIPLTVGVAITIIVVIIASISLYLGLSSPTSRTFRYTVGAAPTIIALVNMYILSAFGLARAIVASALGVTSIGTGKHPYTELRAWLASILLALLAMGVTALLSRSSAAQRHMQTPRGTAQPMATRAPSFGAAAPAYPGGPQAPQQGVTGLTNFAPSAAPSAPNSW